MGKKSPSLHEISIDATIVCRIVRRVLHYHWDVNQFDLGLLLERYPDDPKFQNMSLFAIGKFGVPVAFVGIAYILLMTPLLLDRKKNEYNTSLMNSSSSDDLLLGAKLTQWSPAAGRTIKRSGLRDTGGVYLVSVKRQATGNVHTAVSPEFVVEVGDVLYFTGLIETFGDFCDEHGLEIETSESSSIIQVTSVDESLQNEILGTTLDSLMESTQQERLRLIFSMEDAIRGESSDYQTSLSPRQFRIVIAKQEYHEGKESLVIAIDSGDRPGLLLDISKCLARLELELHHTEAAVRNTRSLSIWRCQLNNQDDDVSKVWNVIQMLFAQSGVEAMRQRGLQVIRVRVRDGRLACRTLSDIPDFREMYKSAVVAIIQKNGKVHTESLASVTLDVGDQLILQVSEQSPLLESPPESFYTGQESKKKMGRGLDSNHSNESDTCDIEGADGMKEKEAVWNDLEVIQSRGATNETQREFLTAMTVAKSSGLVGKTVAQAGIDKLPGVFLVSIDRPFVVPDTTPSMISFSTVPLTEMLHEDDVIWFSGTASSVGDLRKIPGLVLYESGEVDKMNEKVQNRRLVEAVVSRNGPLVGKTPKEIKFRTSHGAAVIAVHREGRRVHELPGNIKLQAGDVLLLEAGKTFLLANKNRHDKAFTLIAEVEDSSPPRFRMLIPAVILTVGAYVCYMLKLSTLFGTAMIAAIMMVICGVLSEEEARSAIRWEIYLTIAPAFGVGSALINSGVAGAMATFLVNLGNAMGIGNAGVLGSVYVCTVLMSQVVANNAAAALIFPIAMDAAEQIGMDLSLMAYAIMLAASAAFMTPFGYQTNLMVMNPGGYSTSDFLIMGTPMQVVLAFVTTIALVVRAWWLVWLVSFAVMVVVSILRVQQDRKKIKRDA
eukprot:g8017.t1.1.5e17418a g8017  g8017.t1 contig27:269-3016(-)